MRKLQQLLIRTRGERSREHIARRTQRIPGGVELDRRALARIELDYRRPPPGDVLRTLCAAYELPLLDALEALGAWPPLPGNGQGCTAREFVDWCRARGLQIRLLNQDAGVAAVEGLRG